MSRIGVTGATGLVGGATVRALHDAGHTVRALVRRVPNSPIDGADETIAIGDIGATTDWYVALQGLDVVIHAAARAHVMQETAVDVDATFRAVNTDGPAQLARMCVQVGVPRLVFISSIKVNGEGTKTGHPFTADDVPNPDDPYARSKHDAEVVLREITAGSSLSVVIIRPPLVYGPGAAGNLARLWRWIGSKRPLPLGLVRNRRDMIGVDNLADVLSLAALHPKVPNKTYVVRDGAPVSTADLVRLMAKAQDVPVRLWPVPVWALRLAGVVTGRSATIQRLIGDLEIDDTAFRRDLGWTPRLTMLQGFDRIAAHARDASLTGSTDL